MTRMQWHETTTVSQPHLNVMNPYLLCHWRTTAMKRGAVNSKPCDTSIQTKRESCWHRFPHMLWLVESYQLWQSSCNSNASFSFIHQKAWLKSYCSNRVDKESKKKLRQAIQRFALHQEWLAPQEQQLHTLAGNVTNKRLATLLDKTLWEVPKWIKTKQSQLHGPERTYSRSWSLGITWEALGAGLCITRANITSPAPQPNGVRPTWMHKKPTTKRYSGRWEDKKTHKNMTPKVGHIRRGIITRGRQHTTEHGEWRHSNY